MENLLTLEQLSQDTINEGSVKKVRSFYISQKKDGVEVGDALTLTAQKFKMKEEDVKKVCDDILDEKKNY